MSSRKPLGKKLKLAKLGKVVDAPRWADIKKFGMKRARTRRMRSRKKKHWRRRRLKV